MSDTQELQLALEIRDELLKKALKHLRIYLRLCRTEFKHVSDKDIVALTDNISSVIAPTKKELCAK